jgi:hypothetical protein
VKLPAEPYSKGFRKHHERENTTQREYVNTFLFIIFRMRQAIAVPRQFSLFNEMNEQSEQSE